jgi:hypothetical protein
MIVFIVLQHGLFIEHFSLSNITIKNIYIKWDEKLNCSIDKITIQKESQSSTTHDLNDLTYYLQVTSNLLLLTNSIVIEKLQYDTITATLSYDNQDKGILSVKTPFTDLSSHFFFRNNLLVFHIDKLTALDKKININGNMFLNMQDHKLYSKLHIVVDKKADLILYSVAGDRRLDYRIIAQKDIQQIHQLLLLFPLPKAIEFWARDAIDAKTLTLNSCKGFIQYNDMPAAYRHLYIDATLHKLNYTYNKKLDAIHTDHTDLEFKNGILYIRPKQAYSYQMPLGKSWLKIDFTKPQEYLTLHLLFNGMLNKSMLKILRTYKIKLPFLQHSGTVKTDLTLKVNLRTVKIDAKGTFQTKKANFDYLGLNLDIKNTLIKLHNYDVNIPKMSAAYKNIAKAFVTVRFDAKHTRGKIDFQLQKLQLSAQRYLNTGMKPLHIRYNINPNGDSIRVQKSQWMINQEKVLLDAITISFNLKKLQLHIPTTLFHISNIADGFITGGANLHNKTADFHIDLLHLHFQAFKLDQTDSEFLLHYDKTLFIKSKDKLSFRLNGTQYALKNLNINVTDSSISIAKSILTIGKYIQTQLTLNYKTAKNSADIVLHNFKLFNPKNKKILYNKRVVRLFATVGKKETIVRSKELHATFFLTPSQWSLHLNNIASIAQNSTFLKKYHINNGKITFYKKAQNPYMKFKGYIDYKYKLLSEGSKTIGHYALDGYLTKSQTLYIDINDKVNLKFSDNIKIALHNSGINSQGLINFIEMLSQNREKSSKKESVTNIFFQAKNTYIYLGYNRFIMADAIHLQYYKKAISAQLLYANGKAGFKFKNNSFELYGNNFNDHFMDKLFSLSKFTGGSLDFSLNGKLDNYNGTFYIKDTTIHDYVLLNNILAFINTVPSLATFSLPGYNKHGLHIDNAYMKFHFHKHIFDISDIYIGSKEIKILGKGDASVKYNNINLTLNLKTDLAKNLSKIPLVGYILFDGESISTTLKITGKLTDPKVKTMLARDIAVAPLNIILRTVTLPYKIVKDIKDYNGSK